MPSLVTQRFVKCHDQLKAEGTIKSSRQFAQTLDFQPQNLSEIIRGRRDAPLELIRKGVERYAINPMYLYAGEGSMFMKKGERDAFRVLTVVTDHENAEKIVHIPVPAQAGYSQEQLEPYFFENLPTYSLPDHRFNLGTFRSFDVAGDSMEPTIRSGDKVICRYVEHSDWLSAVRDHHVYVVVTRSGLMVKRLINNLQKHRHFELRSDNSYYKPVRVNVGEVKEIWMVTAVLSNFSHALPDDLDEISSYDCLQETIDNQSVLISHLHLKLEQILAKA